MNLGTIGNNSFITIHMRRCQAQWIWPTMDCGTTITFGKIKCVRMQDHIESVDGFIAKLLIQVFIGLIFPLY